MNENIIDVSGDDFEEEVVHSDLPVLVDFWAEWCAPCRRIALAIDEIAEEFKGRVKVAKLNIDNNQEIPAKYGVRGIPTLILFKNGQETQRRVGTVTLSQLKLFLNQSV